MNRRFKVKKRRVVFSKGPVHLVDCKVRVGDRVLSRQILEHPGSVVIIPKIGPDRYLLVRQFRFAARQWLWEFPAGGLERGESLTEAAVRELMEEVGYRPRRLKKLLKFYPSPGISSEVMHLFLAESLVRETAIKDEDEEIEIHEVSSATIVRMIRSGAICDAKTIISFFYIRDRNV